MNNLPLRACTKTRTLDDGRWTVDPARWTVDSGPWTMDEA